MICYWCGVEREREPNEAARVHAWARRAGGLSDTSASATERARATDRDTYAFPKSDYFSARVRVFRQELLNWVGPRATMSNSMSVGLQTTWIW